MRVTCFFRKRLQKRIPPLIRVLFVPRHANLGTCHCMRPKDASQRVILHARGSSACVFPSYNWRLFLMLGCEPLNPEDTSKNRVHAETLHVHTFSERPGQTSRRNTLSKRTVALQLEECPISDIQEMRFPSKYNALRQKTNAQQQIYFNVRGSQIQAWGVQFMRLVLKVLPQNVNACLFLSQTWA